MVRSTRFRRSRPRLSAEGILCGSLAAVGGLALLRCALGSQRYSFRNKVVVITGGARGLGLVIARKLAAEGAILILCSRDSDELANAKQQLSQSGVHVTTFRCDVTDQAQVESMIRQTVDVWRRVDVLINNAGIIQVGPMESMQLGDYREAMDTHFWGPLYAIRAVLPLMRAQGGGRIVNVSSIGGRISVPHLLPYSASKFALAGLSEGLRAELAKDSILVTTVFPGLMRTGSPRNAFFKANHRAEYAWFAISDSLPLASMSAERAAEKIIDACRRGSAAVTLSLPAKAAETFHSLFPGLTSSMLGMINRMLPRHGGIGTQRARGFESESALAPSLLTALSDQAAVQNNQCHSD